MENLKILEVEMIKRIKHLREFIVEKPDCRFREEWEAAIGAHLDILRVIKAIRKGKEYRYEQKIGVPPITESDL